MTFEEYWEQFGFEENSLNVYIPKSDLINIWDNHLKTIAKTAWFAGKEEGEKRQQEDENRRISKMIREMHAEEPF